MKIDSRLTFDKVAFDQDTNAHLVLSLTAPKVDADTVRPKLAIVVCIDTSSSMGGQKLEYARLSLQKMIDHLKADDYLGIVSFDTDVHDIAKPTQLVNGKKDELRKLVNNLRARGSTNFAGGMLRAIDLLKDADIGANYLQRVVMFTDGQANVGPARDAEGILRLFKANAPEHITASAFGYGRGNGDFDPDFLGSFAREGKGNYAHVEDPDKALKAFGTELGGLISTYATDLKIEVKPLAGHTIERVISDVDAEDDVTGEVTIKVSDLLAEETRHIVLAVKLAKQKGTGPRAVNVFEVAAGFDVFDATGKKSAKSAESKAKVQFVKDGEQQKDAHGDLDDIVGLAQLVRAQLEAEEHAKRGEFNTAAQVMSQQVASFNTRGRRKLAAAASQISERMNSAGAYASSTGFLRSFAGGATRGMGVSSYSEGSDQVLQDLGVSLSNSYQASTADSFSVDHSPPAAQPVVAPVTTTTHSGGYVPFGSTGDAMSWVAVIGNSTLGAPPAPILVAPEPLPTKNETDRPDTSSGPARKRVKQSRSKTGW